MRNQGGKILKIFKSGGGDGRPGEETKIEIQSLGRPERNILKHREIQSLGEAMGEKIIIFLNSKSRAGYGGNGRPGGRNSSN